MEHLRGGDVVNALDVVVVVWCATALVLMLVLEHFLRR